MLHFKKKRALARHSPHGNSENDQRCGGHKKGKAEWTGII